ncbi:hypothetical protein [Streptosporangium lutulentum]|uniref:DUF1963 domain-containing protein n=1 Tax=Streptosporangium lutulentum TaxID=1461250 RepID=A0ABT9QE19_9ACTN|nr:hypothetical protein [Streptosporangium lutulentum]MDP9844578.1 hypothetical protein [Streptosporangium lutulentum]
MIDGDDGLAYEMVFSRVDEVIEEFATKLGGQPIWLEEPRWPLCARHERPMGFIGQFRLPGGSIRMAYLFMGDGCEESWRPEGGENALIVQPGRIPRFVQTVATDRGESLVGELFADLEEVEQVEPRHRWESRLLGAPTWLQFEEYPDGGPWTFFFQLRSSQRHMYELNFGDGGMGYGFLSADEQEGRFLWQC